MQRIAWIALVIASGAVALWLLSRSAPPPPRVRVVRVPVAVATPAAPVPAAAPVAPPNTVALTELLPLPAAQRTSRLAAFDHAQIIVRTDAPLVADVARAIVAVHVAPADVVSRTAVACGLARLGLSVEARTVAAQLQAVRECPRCADAAAAAAQCIDGTVGGTTLRKAANAVLVALEQGDADAIAPYVTAPVTVTTICSVCDTGVSHDKRWTPAELAAQLRLDGADADKIMWRAPALLFCDATCCTGPTGYLTHSATSIAEVCFAGGKLASITALAG